MNKEQFLNELKKGLSGIPKEDLDERVNFYSEMIDDRIEEGMSEEEAVSAIGDVKTIVSQIMAETPITTIVKERVNKEKEKKKGGISVATLIIIVLTFPLWLPIVATIFGLAIALFAVVWSLVVAFYAVTIGLIVAGAASIVWVLGMLFYGNLAGAGLGLGAGLFCLGLGVLMVYGCVAFTKGAILLTVKALVGIKKALVGKERE
ncbi:MAG: DUF1700 domain-containing protein [Lachnospiraceae bacterium]|nr:DUF1700 domain-containing protein [Lachnospiraceae bacterium]MBR5790039.1 DUF1700 domain-containing protein [Lachnospiraceae bacterium]